MRSAWIWNRRAVNLLGRQRADPVSFWGPCGPRRRLLGGGSKGHYKAVSLRFIGNQR